MRIAAAAASRPPGAAQDLAGREPPGPPRAPSTTRPAIPSGNPAKRAHNCIRRQMPTAAIACYLPRHRPFAEGTLKCAATAINMSSGRPLARNFRTAAGRHHGIIAAKRVVPRSSEGPGHSLPLAGPLLAAAQARDLPGQAPAHRHRNSTEISAVH